MASQITYYKICLTLVLFLCGCSTSTFDQILSLNGSDWSKSQVVEMWGSPTRSFRCDGQEVWHYETFQSREQTRPDDYFVTFEAGHVAQAATQYSCNKKPYDFGPNDQSLEAYLMKDFKRGTYKPVGDERYVEYQKR